MNTVHLRLQFSDKFSEMLPGDVEHTELTIESLVGTALLEIFDTVFVDNVTVQRSPARINGDLERGSDGRVNAWG